MTNTPTIAEINCTTGQVTERPLTAEEISQMQVDAANQEAEQTAQIAAIAAKAAAKASAEAKLAELGLTPEEIAALR